jgi:hypothetical protein
MPVDKFLSSNPFICNVILDFIKVVNESYPQDVHDLFLPFVRAFITFFSTLNSDPRNGEEDKTLANTIYSIINIYYAKL